MDMDGDIQGPFTRVLSKTHKFSIQIGVESSSGRSRGFLSVSLWKSPKKSRYITIKWFKKIKEINKSLNRKWHTTIEDDFWSTEVNFWPISANEGSLRVSDAVLVHLQWSQTEYGVKKPSSSGVSCLKTDLEHSFLSYHKGPQRQKYV